MDIKKLKLKNYKEANSDFGLYAEEVDVVLAVLFHVLEARGIPVKGTFRLDSQKRGDESRKIVEFNFRGGKKRHFYGGDRDSEQVAGHVLAQAATYTWGNGMGAIRNGFNNPAWMNLEANGGRFLAVFYADAGCDSSMKEVYLAVAKAISMLAENDRMLQESFGMTVFGQFEDIKWATALDQYIDNLFEKEKLPEIKAWKEWHRSPRCDRKEEFFN